MAIQLTPEQEQRIQAIVNAGAYPTAREALDAAVAAVELVAAPGFEGSNEELGSLLLEGLNSKELSEEEFWKCLKSPPPKKLQRGLYGLRYHAQICPLSVTSTSSMEF